MKYQKNDYKKAEIEDKFKDNKKITLRLTDYNWQYVKSMTINKLKINRKIFLDHLRPEDRDYILQTWKPKEYRVIWCYTHFYLNLDSTSSQRGESYHLIICQITNGQLFIK